MGKSGVARGTFLGVLDKFLWLGFGIMAFGLYVIITGKVLGSGNLNKKIRICSMSFSESAKRKLKGKSEMVSVSDEVKKNPKAEGVKILR